MKRSWCAAAVAVSAISMAGCSPVWNDAPHRAIDTHLVDLTTLPDELPTSVQEVVGQTVLVERPIQDGKIVLASGMRVSDTKIITAGHMFIDGHSQSLDAYSKCGSFLVNGLVRNDVDSNNQSQPIGQANVGRAVFATMSTNYSKPDAALVSIDPGSYQKTIDIGLSTSTLQPGTLIFISSYQPVSNANRDPLSITQIVGKDPHALQSPAIMGGIVLRKDKNDRIVIATNLKSYGEISESFVRGGSSGAAALDADGQLIGDVIEATTETMTADQEEAASPGIRISQNSRSIAIQEVIVQGLTAATWTTMSQNLSKQKVCEWPKFAS